MNCTHYLLHHDRGGRLVSIPPSDLGYGAEENNFSDNDAKSLSYRLRKMANNQFPEAVDDAGSLRSDSEFDDIGRTDYNVFKCSVS